MKPTLLILAAGMASRYGSLKQLDGVGPNNETIMDYSIYDAIESGFGKIVFVIREDFAEPFKAAIEPKWKDKITLEYAFQPVDVSLNGKEIKNTKKVTKNPKKIFFFMRNPCRVNLAECRYLLGISPIYIL